MRGVPALVIGLVLGLGAGGGLGNGAFAKVPLSKANLTPPSIEYGQLYRDVELGRIFPDSKTFPDLIPDRSPADIVTLYDQEKDGPSFSLKTFVGDHFTKRPTPDGPTIDPATGGTGLLDYVASLWPKLAQKAITLPDYTTLQPLPKPYVVPGGRFREVYYWDSYFTIRGLLVDNQDVLARDLLQDFAYELDRYGRIPNGSRSYYLSRSQPPFFASIVSAIAMQDGTSVLTKYLPQLRKEWEFWMNGADTAPRGTAFRRVIKLADGTLLNRYHDQRQAPRDESYYEDVQTAKLSNRPAPLVWENLRATAESGWDFSSRWLADGKTLATVHTDDIAPVDLNCLIDNLEATLAIAYAVSADYNQALRFAGRAAARAAAIERLMFDKDAGYFTDYFWADGKRTGVLSAATLYPLFFHVATKDEATRVAGVVSSKLLDKGGLDTTLVESGQQWDKPNGWAPLQLIAVEGLRSYGQGPLAKDIATRFVRKIIAGYAQTGKLVEKYNVTTTGGDFGGGGEYATQIGFGWTNGVLLALTAIYPELKAEAGAAKSPR